MRLRESTKIGNNKKYSKVKRTEKTMVKEKERECERERERERERRMHSPVKRGQKGVTTGDLEMV